MWQFIRSRILTVIIFIGAAHGMLVVGPKFIRANQDYTVVISNFKLNATKLDLKLSMEGHTSYGRNILNITKTVDVRKYSNRIVNFNMPENLSDGNYKITIDGQNGFSFHKEANLVYQQKSIAGLIQISKPVFKPGDTVQFRVIVLDHELKPPARVNTIHVRIHAPDEQVIREWSTAKLYAGVFENELQIATSPFLGMWQITVLVNGEEVVSKEFEVKEYVLSLFDLNVYPSTIPLEEHQALSLTIKAEYHFGKPVNGLAKVELYLEDDELDQRKEFEVYGTGQVELRFKGELSLYEHSQNVRVRTTFIEQYTNRTVVKDAPIAVYKHKYRVELIKESPQFRPAYSFKCALQFRFHDGTPAAGITGEVKVDEIGYLETATSDKNGLIKLELYPNKDVTEMSISFHINSEIDYTTTVHKVDVVTDTFIKLELKSPSTASSVKLNQTLRFTVRCNEQMTFFVYYVVSKGNIIESGYMRPNKQTKFPLQLKATEKMVPKAKIIVSTVVNQTVVYDFVDIDFKDFRNNFHMTIDEEEVKPGRQIQLRMSGRPRAYVGLAAYDKGLLFDNKHHDLFRKNVMQEFDGFHAINENEFDNLHSMGLFGETLDGIEFSGAHGTSSRYGSQENSQITKLVPYRTNFPESWLWENVTLERSGKRSIFRVVPDTTTSWYLTGFSIDPEYGFGIIKQPIQLTTIQPFYIVENLPYSIKRGEAVVLQFTLFNNLGAEFIADVTLYNVANQMEFIGRPLEDLSYTNSLSVKSNVGVPVSFLVKARKLGEMVVRVKASIMVGKETDALEKVIRVMPESVTISKTESRFFSLNTYTNKTFTFNLDFDKKADNGSKKIEFRLTPNLLTSVIENLDDLLAVPTGSGEQNMIKFVPNIIVLEYLKAIGSKEQRLIDKATNLLHLGYQNQLRYRLADGSFAIWQNSSGSVFLTAFVAKSMQTASKYISEVDAAMVEKAYDWLASKQHYSGRFDEVGSVIHKDMQGGLRNGIALTSYVLTALLENEHAKVKHADVIQKAMNYLSSRVKSIDNPYDLSIATYALMLHGHSMGKTALEKLIANSTTTGQNNDMQRYWDTSNSIEATAYALLSFVIAGKYVDGIPVMRWLVNQRYVTGSFPRTQDTFVGLKALTKLAEIISPLRNEYIIILNNKLNRNQQFSINSQDIDVTNYEDIPQNTKQLEITVAGIGFGLLEVIYQQDLDLQNFENSFQLTLTRYNTGSSYELRLNVCASFIATLAESLSNMVMIEVTFPSGYVVDRNPISARTWGNPIQLIQTKFGATSVVVYYDNMGKERNCFTVTAYRRFMVTMKRPAHVVVYDSVNPNWNAIELYAVDD